jgi:hypothetical protein
MNDIRQPYDFRLRKSTSYGHVRINFDRLDKGSFYRDTWVRIGYDGCELLGESSKTIKIKVIGIDIS